MILATVAICFLGLALIRSSWQWREYRTLGTYSILNWTPPYAPDFKAMKVKQPAGNCFTIEAINGRRTEAEAITADDNSEFIPDLFGYRCKVCSVMHVRWLDAFRCHPRTGR